MEMLDFYCKEAMEEDIPLPAQMSGDWENEDSMRSEWSLRI